MIFIVFFSFLQLTRSHFFLIWLNFVYICTVFTKFITLSINLDTRNTQIKRILFKYWFYLWDTPINSLGSSRNCLLRASFDVFLVKIKHRFLTIISILFKTVVSIEFNTPFCCIRSWIQSLFYNLLLVLRRSFIYVDFF